MTAPDESGSRARVLFVDDEAGIRLTFPAILRKQGFEVSVAASVPEALAQLAAQPFDVLIADLNIGDIGDGFTVVSAMRRTQPNCINFILTGYPAFENALRAIQAQVDDYFVKPADVATMVARIRERLSGHVSRLELEKKTLATLLREQAPEIRKRVLTAMKHSSELEPLPLSDQERVDSLPGLLREVAEMLDAAGAEVLPANRSSASQHGVARREQGYSVPMLIEDARLLERTIFEVVQEHIMELNLSRLVTDLSLVVEAMNSQLLASSRAFVSAATDAA
jgi:DNA-binding response OmpR family regulator